MHPAVEGPGLAMQKPLRDLVAALLTAGEGAWYGAIEVGGVPCVAHVAVGPEALALADYVDRRRSQAPGTEDPMLYDKDGRLVEDAKSRVGVLLAWLAQLRANTASASDSLRARPLTPTQKMEAMTTAEMLDASLAMTEDFVKALLAGDDARVSAYIASAAKAGANPP